MVIRASAGRAGHSALCARCLSGQDSGLRGALAEDRMYLKFHRKRGTQIPVRESELVGRQARIFLTEAMFLAGHSRVPKL